MATKTIERKETRISFDGDQGFVSFYYCRLRDGVMVHSYGECPLSPRQCQGLAKWLEKAQHLQPAGWCNCQDCEPTP